jgi:hypothetical protein
MPAEGSTRASKARGSAGVWAGCKESRGRLIGPGKARGPPAGCRKSSERLTEPGKARGPPAESKKSSGSPAGSGESSARAGNVAERLTVPEEAAGRFTGTSRTVERSAGPAGQQGQQWLAGL